jgi:AraC-like DNA-binding protein
MDTYNNLKSCLANGLRLPTFIVKDGAAFLPNTAAALLGGELQTEDIPRVRQSGQIQYLRNSFYECFIFAWIQPGHELWVGPILTAAVTENMVAELIRAKKLSIRKRARLSEHYASLPLLTDDQYFYAGQIVQGVLRGEAGLRDIPEVKAKRAEPVLSARREAERRLSLFEHSPYFMEMEMTRLVTHGDVENALNAMNRINTFSRARLANDPIRSIKNSLICNCTFLARAAIAGGVSPEEAFALSDKLIMRIEDTNSVEQLVRQERDSLIEFVEMVHLYNTSHHSKPVREVVSFINEHLSEKISLGQLAERVFMHPNYLCALFKKEAGITLVKYILKRKIEEAKFFLRYTQNSVADVAAFYHFSSQSYFIRCFKEITGQTPLQYRNSSDA